MQYCVKCGGMLERAFEPSSTLPLSGACPGCGSTLRATLRLRPLILALAGVCGAFLKLVTIPFSPRVNVSKLAAFPFYVEATLAQLLWKTKMVNVQLAKATGPRSP